MVAAETQHTDNYSVESILGKGGMGVVYLAFDKRLNRKVAIKCIRHNRTNENWVDAVTEEARLLAQINHRNIVHIYDLIDWQGAPALVMEYLQGRTLLDIFRSDEIMSPKLSLATRLDWLRQIADGLACAHAKGIIHRDLKPENVMITDEGVVKIMDFGIARHQAQPLHDNIHDSQVLPGEFIGSPAALSPEQAIGDRLTTASDVFSFGMLAYSLLCGHHPFGDAKNADQVLQGIIYRPPMPVRFLECLALEGKDAQVIGDTLLNCLNKTAGMRPNAQTCADRMVLTPPTSPVTFTREPRPTRRPWAAALALLLPLVAYGLYVLLSHQPTRHVAILAPVIEPIDNADDNTQALVSTAFSDTLYQRMIATPGVVLVDPEEWEEGAELRDIFRTTGATHIVTPKLSCTLHRCDLWISIHGLSDAKPQLIGQKGWQIIAESLEDIYLTAWQSVDSILQLDGPNLDVISAEKYNTYLRLLDSYLANSWLDNNDLQTLKKLTESSPLFPPAIRLRTKAAIDHFKDTNDGKILAEMNTLLDDVESEIPSTDFLEQKIKVLTAVSDFDKAEELLKQLRIEGNNFQYHKLSASLLIRQNKFPQAITELNALLNIRRSTSTLYSIAYCYYAIGDIESTKKYLHSLLELKPDDTRALNFLGSLLITQGKYKDAIEIYQALSLTAPHPAVFSNLAISHFLIGNLLEAERIQKKALEASPNQPSSLSLMGEIHLAQGKRESAEYFFRETLKKIKPNNDISDHVVAAMAAIHIGDSEGAEKRLISARNIQPDNVELIYAEAMHQTYLGNNEAALELVKKSLDNGYSKEWFAFRWFRPLCSDEFFRGLFSEAGTVTPCSGNLDGSSPDE